MVQILEQWEQLKEIDEYVPLYGRIRKYFGYMDTGWQGKKYEIFAYNGGLFKPDEVLDGAIDEKDYNTKKHGKRQVAMAGKRNSMEGHRHLPCDIDRAKS